MENISYFCTKKNQDIVAQLAAISTDSITLEQFLLSDE